MTKTVEGLQLEHQFKDVNKIMDMIKRTDNETLNKAIKNVPNNEDTMTILINMYYFLENYKSMSVPTDYQGMKLVYTS